MNDLKKNFGGVFYNNHSCFVLTQETKLSLSRCSKNWVLKGLHANLISSDNPFIEGHVQYLLIDKNNNIFHIIEGLRLMLQIGHILDFEILG